MNCNLDDNKISKLQIMLPKIKMNPLSEAMLILRILSATPDIESFDDLIKINPAKENGIALFEGEEIDELLLELVLLI